MFDWDILEVLAECLPEGDLITAARYLCRVIKDGKTVETEGWWHFPEPTLNKPYLDVTKDDIVGWIDTQAVRDGRHLIKDRLLEQLNATSVVRPAPWQPQVFTPELN